MEENDPSRALEVGRPEAKDEFPALQLWGNHWRELCLPRHNQKSHGAEVPAASRAPLLPALWEGFPGSNPGPWLSTADICGWWEGMSRLRPGLAQLAKSLCLTPDARG